MEITPMFTAFAVTWLGVIAAQASPGPNFVAVASVALAQGRRPALFVVAGVASGMLLWSVATGLGLGTLIAAFPAVLWLLKLVGGAYLLFLALKTARALVHKRANTAVAPSTIELSDRAAWRRGLLVVMTNPKAALMWAAVASFLFGLGLQAYQVVMFGPLGALSGLVIYGCYAWLFSTGRARQGYTRFARWFDAVMALVFGAMGVSLVWSGVAEVVG